MIGNKIADQVTSVGKSKEKEKNKENYRLIAIDLIKQTKLKDPQQVNFIGKLQGTRP